MIAWIQLYVSLENHSILVIFTRIMWNDAISYLYVVSQTLIRYPFVHPHGRIQDRYLTQIEIELSRISSVETEAQTSSQHKIVLLKL